MLQLLQLLSPRRCCGLNDNTKAPFSVRINILTASTDRPTTDLPWCDSYRAGVTSSRCDWVKLAREQLHGSGLRSSSRPALQRYTSVASPIDYLDTLSALACKIADLERTVGRYPRSDFGLRAACYSTHSSYSHRMRCQSLLRLVPRPLIAGDTITIIIIVMQYQVRHFTAPLIVLTSLPRDQLTTGRRIATVDRRLRRNKLCFQSFLECLLYSIEWLLGITNNSIFERVTARR